jgi:protein-glutamine gamma-glutamyltransferase
VTIRDLDTNLFPVAGTALQISGADPVVVPSEDGTVEALGESLDEGDTYTVEAYVPDPTPAQMRAAPADLLAGRPLSVPNELLPYTEIFLPPRGTTALDGTGRAGDAAREALDLAGPATTAEILASPYARVMRLARRLARGQPTGYDVVRAIQSHLRTEYSYNERPPSQEFPLAAFLFEDGSGCCQQFSGAMALMLRLLEIPARVAAGFTPGSYNSDTKEYRVRDLDAHSWVEVWFDGIGWVPFDPTPSVAPAESPSSADAASASGGVSDAGETPDPRGISSTALSERAGDPGLTSDPEDAAIEGWMAVVAAALLIATGFGLLRIRALVRRRRTESKEDRELAPLRRLLARIDGPVSPRVTLWQVESRLERVAGPPAARYVRMLRVRRYSAGGGRMPDATARRELRRALVRGRGLRARFGALSALPPVSFRRG